METLQGCRYRPRRSLGARGACCAGLIGALLGPAPHAHATAIGVQRDQQVSVEADGFDEVGAFDGGDDIGFGPVGASVSANSPGSSGLVSATAAFSAAFTFDALGHITGFSGSGSLSTKSAMARADSSAALEFTYSLGGPVNLHFEAAFESSGFGSTAFVTDTGSAIVSGDGIGRFTYTAGASPSDGSVSRSEIVVPDEDPREFSFSAIVGGRVANPSLSWAFFGSFLPVLPLTEYRWLAPLDGDFDVAANWDQVNAPSTSDHAAVFAEAGAYTVRFDTPAETGRALVEAGDVGFDLQGYTYTLDADSGSGLFVSGADTHAGLSNGVVATARTVVDGAGLTVHDDATLSATADVHVNGALTVDGLVIAPALVVAPNGVVTGSGGTIDVGSATAAPGSFVNQGLLSPGASPGQLNVLGDLEQQAGGTLLIEIGGLVPVVDYDRLVVDGAATLAGVVRFEFIDGFAPATNDQFAFLQVAGATDLSSALFEIGGLEPGFLFDIDTTGGAVTLLAQNDGVSVIPLPPALPLFLCATVVTLARTRRVLACGASG